jgi:hypothetical protein
MFAEIDDADVSLVSGHRWHASSRRPGGLYYAQGRVGGRRVYMHRLLMGFPDMEVDHKNGDGLDNRRHNLRVATDSEQGRNSRIKVRMGRTSRFKGVSFWKGTPRHRSGYWKAALWTGEKTIVKYCKTEVAAAITYNDLARAHFGEFARLNMLEGAR